MRFCHASQPVRHIGANGMPIWESEYFPHGVVGRAFVGGSRVGALLYCGSAVITFCRACGFPLLGPIAKERFPCDVCRGDVRRTKSRKPDMPQNAQPEIGF